MQVPKKKVKRRKWEVKSPNRSLNETVSLLPVPRHHHCPFLQIFLCIRRADRTFRRQTKEGKKEKLQISNHLSWKLAA